MVNIQAIQAHDINDNGWIAAIAAYSDGLHAVVLVPYEPCPGELNCDGMAQAPPQTVQDCFNRYGSDLARLEACLETVSHLP